MFFFYIIWTLCGMLFLLSVICRVKTYNRRVVRLPQEQIPKRTKARQYVQQMFKDQMKERTRDQIDYLKHKAWKHLESFKATAKKTQTLLKEKVQKLQKKEDNKPQYNIERMKEISKRVKKSTTIIIEGK